MKSGTKRSRRAPLFSSPKVFCGVFDLPCSINILMFRRGSRVCRKAFSGEGGGSG